MLEGIFFTKYFRTHLSREWVFDFTLNCMLPNNCSITVFTYSIVEGFSLSRIGLFKMLFSVTNVRTCLTYG